MGRDLLGDLEIHAQACQEGKERWQTVVEKLAKARVTAGAESSLPASQRVVGNLDLPGLIVLLGQVN